LLPGGLPRRFTTVIQAGGGPALAASGCELLKVRIALAELVSFRSKLGEHLIDVHSCRIPSVET